MLKDQQLDQPRAIDQTFRKLSMASASAAPQKKLAACHNALNER